MERDDVLVCDLHILVFFILFFNGEFETYVVFVGLAIFFALVAGPVFNFGQHEEGWTFGVFLKKRDGDAAVVAAVFASGREHGVPVNE